MKKAHKDVGLKAKCGYFLLWLRFAFCVKTEAATERTAAGVLGLLNSFAAVDATRADVCSLAVFLVAI